MPPARTIGVAGLIGLCAVSTAWNVWLRRELDGARQAAAQAGAAAANERREADNLRQRLAKSTAAVSANRATAATPESEAPAAMSELERAAWTREQRHDIVRRYAEGISALHLSPEKAAALKRLLLEISESQFDTFDASRAAGLAPDSPGFAQAMAQTYKDAKGEIISLIGNDGWKQLQDSAQLSIYRGEVTDDFAYDFQDAGVPLTPAQQLTLADALKSADEFFGPVATGQSSPLPINAATGLKPADDAILAAAAETLSPDQIRVLRNSLIEENRSDMNGTITSFHVISVTSTPSHP